MCFLVRGYIEDCMSLGYFPKEAGGGGGMNMSVNSKHFSFR